MNNYIEQTMKSPFTSIYPRLNRFHALHTLKNLDDFLIIDCETTGVDKHSEITELAIVDYQSGQVMFNSLLRPYVLDGYENSKARGVSGISTRELLNAPSLLEVWDEVFMALQWKHLTAFNSDFDLRMIRNSAHIWGIDIPPLEATCLMKLTTAFFNLDYWLSLDEAAKHFGVDLGIRHRALGDALVTREVVIKMKDDARTNGRITRNE
jgi:DNA polymerase III subunit epsilon